MPLVTFALLLAGLFMGWGIGSNDAANAMGTAVGAGARTIREAVGLVAAFGLLGALLLGGRVTPTVGRGVFPIERLGGVTGQIFALAVCLGGGLTVALSTGLRLPTATSHAIIGAVLGCGAALGKIALVQWPVLFKILTGWILTPATGCAFGYLLYREGRRLFRRFFTPKLGGGFWKGVLTLSGCCLAFAWGANDVANVAGPLCGSGILSLRTATILGGVAMGLGVVTWGPRVMETVGHRITRLFPGMALAAELAAALNVTVYTFAGLPASSSHSIVGAVFGVGLVYGRRALDLRTLGEILAAWLTTPLLGFGLGFFFLQVVRFFSAVAAGMS